ncbi:hypothetical protein L5515_002326 [Caenorhabditis briggsae]|uniref:C2H2-type domain-containing protein n=1 Tax=Caenorhabditis briggsae TaxID=6238 RepID=A0AAE9E3U2_CAEBR|nr:hypothetical protein L5515_002326 [Caenorhabditis briggsae]
MENPEKFSCKWDTCRAEFSSQLDMGLHVLTNHLEILDYGHFVLQKSVVKAPEEPATKKPRIEAPESSRTFLEPRESFPTSSELQFPRLQDSRMSSRVLELEDEAEYVENSVGEKTKIPRQRDSDDAVAMPILEKIVPVEISRKVSSNTYYSNMASVARSLYMRSRVLPRSHIYFQSEFYCLICFENLQSPCQKQHSVVEFCVVKEVKKRLKNLGSIEKKDLAGHLRQMMVEYDEETLRLEDSQEMATSSETATSSDPLETMTSLEDLQIEYTIPQNQPSTSSAAVQRGGPFVFESARRGPGRPANRRNRIMGQRGLMLLKEPKREEPSFHHYHHDSAPPSPPQIHRSSPEAYSPSHPQFPSKKIYPKMSKLCQGVINQLRGRGLGQFRASDRTHFCLTCLSFKKCTKQHDEPWRELERVWRSEYGNQRVIPDELVNQMEEMKHRFQCEEEALAVNESPSPESFQRLI